MNQRPMGWTSTALEDVCDVIRGITFPASAKEMQHTDSNVCCLRTSNIQHEIDWMDVYFVPKAYVKRDEQLVRVGDILMSMANSYDLVGKVAVARSVEYKSAFGAFLAAIRPTLAIDGQYLFHLLRTAEVQTALRSGSTQTTNIANISVKTLAGIDVPIAPLNEQKRIADKLDRLLARVDAAKARLDKIPPLLKRLRQAILAAATSGQLTEEWRVEKASIGTGKEVISIDAEKKRDLLAKDAFLAKKKSSLQAEIEEGYIFDIPSAWSFTTWGAVSEWITYGFTRPMPHQETGIPLITAKDVNNFNLDFSECRFTPVDAFNELSEKDRPQEGDLLITKDGTIGRVALVRTNQKFCINQSVAVCWLRSTTMEKNYLEIVANSDFTQRFIADKAKGMAIQHLSITDFAQCPLPVPPMIEQKEIVRRVEELFTIADRIEAQYRTARARVDRLTQSLLAKAFRGELVPQDPNDEPAAALLERLRAQRSAAPARKKRKS